MYDQKRKLRFLCLVSVTCLLSVIILGGCISPEAKVASGRPGASGVPGIPSADAQRDCPGQSSADEAFAALNSSGQDGSFIAYGQCKARFYNEGKKYDENFKVKLWVDPPHRLRLHGDIFFNARGIDLGANSQQFWLIMKPKEIDTYWWGQWSQQNGAGNLMLNPKALVEALGVVDSASAQDWKLSKDGGYDVLAGYNYNGQIAKKVYIGKCDYKVRRIEYFGSDGKISMVTQMDRYKQVAGGSSVPGVIEMINHTAGSSGDSVRIKLNSVKPKTLGYDKRAVLFQRPGPKNIKHVYRVVDGAMYQQ